MSNYLIVSPHADDAEIGMGGTILSLTEAQQGVTILYLTATEERKIEARNACEILGATPIFWDLTDGILEIQLQLDTVKEKFVILVRSFEKVFVPNRFETHPDHSAAHQLGDYALGNVNLVSYEVWTPLLRPNSLVNITPYLSLKQQAIRCHVSQLTNRFDEAVICLNRWRGIMSGTNAFAMEAFFDSSKP